jgi:hypothetical protein
MALLRLPKIHLQVLDALVLHLRKLVFAQIISNTHTDYGIRLIETTDVEETDEVYVTKLALSIGRSKLLLSPICLWLKLPSYSASKG